MQVYNRASYLSDLLVQAQDLAELSDTINQTAQALLDQGVISLDTLENGTTESDPLLQAIAPELVDTLRSKAVAELQMVLELDVDALQGYLLARPGSIPAPIAPEAAEIIRSVNARKKD